MKVDLKMLAAQLGVSVSTVSKALRDSHEIGANTKQKIIAKAEELGYKPNPYASYLRHQKSKTIALVIPKIDNSFFLQIIDGAEAIAAEKGYHLLVYVTHEDVQKEISIIRHLQNGRVDGIIMSLSATTSDYHHLNECMENGLPIVFFDRVCHEIETTKVITDDFACGFKATEHLIENGCKKIVYLSVSEKLSIDKKRMQGYQEALGKHDLLLNEDNIIRCSNDEKNNHELIRNRLLADTQIDGFFSGVESFALSTYAVCRELKIKIPERIKVICFANLATTDFLNPSLTTISQPAYDMASLAATTLFKHLDKKRSQLYNENIVLKSSLVVRESTTKRNKEWI